MTENAPDADSIAAKRQNLIFDIPGERQRRDSRQPKTQLTCGTTTRAEN